jgi:hypothetical protein
MIALPALLVWADLAGRKSGSDVTKTQIREAGGTLRKKFSIAFDSRKLISVVHSS